MPPIDAYSHQCGVMDSFAEMVAAGVKPVALTHPQPSQATRDRYLPYADELADRYGVRYYCENGGLVTDLFPASLNRGTYNLVFYRDRAAIDAYLSIHRHKAALQQAGRYAGRPRFSLAFRLGRLLGYSGSDIRRMVAQNGDREPVDPMPDRPLPVPCAGQPVEIGDISRKKDRFLSPLAALLEQTFPQAYKNCGEEEADALLSPGRVALGALAGGELVGFVGAMPQYGQTGWELHPLLVAPAWQRRGIGTRLVAALQQRVAARDCCCLYLGCDDEFGGTSLAGADLYRDTWSQIENIRLTGDHPYPFYQKQGFSIVGVFPDANGPGRPDIWMAKRIVSE